MLMTGMYAILVDDARTSGNLSLPEAVERVDEMLLPPKKARAAANRRAFRHLLPAETKP